MTLGRSLHYDVATDNLRMVTGQPVNPFSDIRVNLVGCFHIAKSDL